ncbi:MAG: hypothetical protein LUD69_04555 [Oscillospiraceae bacterium]|nr:hypothetical protein [Oscillospiraceae bacterium]
MARNFATKEGAKVQEYCMYFKLLQRTFGGKVSPDAAGAFNQCFLKLYRPAHPLSSRGKSPRLAACLNLEPLSLWAAPRRAGCGAAFGKIQ